MSEMSNEAVQAQINARSLKLGNTVRSQTSDANGVTNVTQLTADANSLLQGTAHLPIVQPDLTGVVFDITGIPNGNIMTQTIVANASATTATAQGWLRVNVVSSNSAIFSTSAYYIQLVSLT